MTKYNKLAIGVTWNRVNNKLSTVNEELFKKSFYKYVFDVRYLDLRGKNRL